jgi:putative aminopeptidase FrvX
MNELQEMLFRLCRAPGVAGREYGAAETALQELSFLPEAFVDHMGSVIARFGNQDAKTHLLLDAHLDQIGLLVTSIDEHGFLRVARDGGTDRRVLPGSHVTVYGKETLEGVVSCLPPHLNEGGEEKVPDITEMAVDVGLSREEAEKLVEPGDVILVPGEPRRLLGSRVTGAALDDRAGCAALIRCAQLLQKEDLGCRVTILLSCREEVGGQGAATASFRETPDMAIAVDVSFAAQPGVPAHKGGKLSEGPMIGISPTLDKGITETLKDLARKEEIPFQLEVMGGSTGTNADEINVSGAGVRCGLVSIPQRNMHTPAEICDLADIENTARLLAAFIKRL